MGFGLFGLLGALIYASDPWPGARWLSYLVVYLAAASAIVVGVRRWHPARVAPWTIAASGIACAGLGDAVAEVHQANPTLMDDVVGIQDVLVPFGYVLLVVGAVLLTRAKRPGRDIDTLLDGTILGMAAFIIGWVALVGPAIGENPSAFGPMLVSVSFVVADLILLAVVGRLGSSPHIAGNRSYHLILAGLLIGIVVDVAFLVRGIQGSVDDGLVGAGSLVAVLCVGAAALLPDIVELSEPVPQVPRRAHPARLGLFAIAALVPSAVFLVADLSDRDRVVVAGASLILAAMVVLRLARLVRRRDAELSARELLELRLAFNATHDPLTGLGNRAWFMDRLDHALSVATRTRRAVGLLFVDLDRFKDVNDGFGHAVGDRALVELGARILDTIRASDSVARFGGDEFVIALEAIDSTDDVLDAAHRVARAIRHPFEVDGHPLVVSATIGVSSTFDGPARSEDLLRDADAALYDGKRRGRNTVIVCDADLRGRLDDRLRVESELRGAAGRGEMVLRYQPEVDLSTGELFGVEALIRWQHPTRGLLGPDRFLPVAERSRLIIEIGSWVIDAACRQAAQWQADLGPDHSPPISINVSPTQLTRCDVAAEISAALSTHHLGPAAIRVEVTETAVLTDVDATVDTLRAIHALGVAIAVDDFGTGYFSLRDLVRYPIDIIKIDQTFVQGLGDGGTEEAIVISTIRLAQTLGRTVIAEGVETRQQATHLRELGCEVAQGFLYSRAVPPEEIPGLRLTIDA